MSTAVFLGIDIGTGSVKGVVTTGSGEILCTAKRDHRMSMPRPGWAEMDVEQDWWQDVTAVSRQIAASLSDRYRIAAVSISGLGPCVVTIDDAGVPRSPGILYGIDTRASEQIMRMEKQLGYGQILKRCGKTLSSQAVGPKLAWLHEHGSRAEDLWFSAHNYVIYRLTGKWVLDHHTASQCDPLYDINTQQWATDWAQEVLPGLLLPPLQWPGEKVGPLLASAAHEMGLAAGTPVVMGTVDAWAEAFSAGVSRPGDLLLMYGSTMFFVQVIPAPQVQEGLWTTSGIVPGSHTFAAGMSTSGSLTQWVQDLCGGVDFPQLVAEAQNIAAGSDGLVILPYFAGERSPIYDPDARGLIAGLTLSHGRGHLFRAAYEGIGFGIRQILEQLGDAAGPPARVVAVGGGTQGGLWTQIVSDICGIDQEIPEITIGACYGDALLAAIGLGVVPASTIWAKPKQIVRPQVMHRSIYRNLYRTYTSLYPATMPYLHRLAAIQSR